MRKEIEKILKDLEKLDWKDFNKVALNNKKILESIFHDL